MKRLLYLILSTFVSLILLIGCKSTDNKTIETVYSYHTACHTFEYNPLQIKYINTAGKNTLSSAFYLGKKNNKHIFITNAHVVVNKDTNYNTRYRIYDKHSHKLNVQLVAHKEIHQVKILTTTPETFIAHQIADIAILEADHLPEGFALSATFLAQHTKNTEAFAKGIGFSGHHWKGCFATVYQGDSPFLLGDGKHAIKSFSGTPVFNPNQNIIGIVTASGHIIHNGKEVPLYANFIGNKFTTVTFKKGPTSIAVFAILTPTSEIRKLLNETYGEYF